MPDGDESDQTVARKEFTASPHMSVTNFFTAHGLDLLAQMVAAGGRNGSAIAAEAAALTANIRKQMWNGTAFCDGICSEVGGNSRVMSNMFSLAFGLVPPANVDSVWGGVTAWGLTQMGDYGAFWYQMAVASGYYAPHYDTPDDGTAIVTALTKCDYYSWCSGLAQDNLTMTRESWHAGTYSHGWGSSGIVGVSWGVLGVHNTAPGWAQFIVMPKLGPLQFAVGQVPNLRGFVTVNATAGWGVEVGVPCGAAATLCTPRSAADGARPLATADFALLLDGEEVAAVERAGHLCLEKPVGCGAGGAPRQLRAQRR
jgi:alpha-L-rhamnosidase